MRRKKSFFQQLFHQHHTLNRTTWRDIVGVSMAGLVISAVTAFGVFGTFLAPDAFDSAPDTSLMVVGVALSNSLGSGIPRETAIPVTLPDDLQRIQSFLLESNLSDTFFAPHFSLFETFDDLLSLDIPKYLSAKKDPYDALESYIDRLEAVNRESEEAVQSLTALVTLHTQSVENNSLAQKNLETQLQSAYTRHDSLALQDLLITQEELAVERLEHESIIRWSQILIQEYTTRLTQSTARITLLRANIRPIAEGVSVDIPAGASLESLKNLNIITTSPQ